MCFFFQAEDGIRDRLVTGVQTCALPISRIGDKAMRSGTATRESTAEGRVQNNIKLLVESEIFDTEFQAGKVGRAIANTGKDISHFELLPKDKEDYKKGQHYFSKKGKLHLYDGKNVLTWNPSTSKFEE